MSKISSRNKIFFIDIMLLKTFVATERVNKTREGKESTKKPRVRRESAPMKGRNLVNGSAVRLVFPLQWRTYMRQSRIYERTRIPEIVADRPIIFPR